MPPSLFTAYERSQEGVVLALAPRPQHRRLARQVWAEGGPFLAYTACLRGMPRPMSACSMVNPMLPALLASWKGDHARDQSRTYTAASCPA